MKPHFPRLVIPVLFASLWFTGLPGSAESSGDPRKEVIRVLTARARAFERGDQLALEELYVREGWFSVIENGHANWGWTDYRDHHLTREMASYSDVKFRMSDLRVQAGRDLAWATFAYHLTGKWKGRDVEAKGLETAILERGEKGWRIVHFHESSPPRRK